MKMLCGEEAEQDVDRAMLYDYPWDIDDDDMVSEYDDDYELDEVPCTERSA